jgi:hypothetical protein
LNRYHFGGHLFSSRFLSDMNLNDHGRRMDSAVPSWIHGTFRMASFMAELCHWTGYLARCTNDELSYVDTREHLRQHAASAMEVSKSIHSYAATGADILSQNLSCPDPRPYD